MKTFFLRSCLILFPSSISLVCNSYLWFPFSPQIPQPFHTDMEDFPQVASDFPQADTVG